MSTNQEFAERRRKLLNALGRNSIGILSAAKECPRNGDTYYPYRQNSDFYYLTGFSEPEAVAVFIPGYEHGEFILFSRERDPVMETWVGPRAGQEGARENFGADQAFPIQSLDEHMPKLLENRQCVHFAIGRDQVFTDQVFSWVNTIRSKLRSGINAPAEFINIEDIIHEMRLRKSESELQLMRKAAEISAKAHISAMKICRPGMMEYELEAEIQSVFLRHGSRFYAYPHIIGAGINTCTLHYNDNNAKIADGDMVLIDSGCEYDYYASDITRSFPANGRFTDAQRAIYDVVLRAQMATIEIVRPKLAWNVLQETTERFITSGLIQLGLLKGPLEKLLEQQACHRFFIHRFGHWLGLDTHDVGPYKINGQWRLLEPGMVFTVEPGIYIPAGSEGIDKKWWNIGIRIEDDILVTEKGCEVLSATVPKSIEAIEKLMS